jgi:hypothetical protein
VVFVLAVLSIVSSIVQEIPIKMEDSIAPEYFVAKTRSKELEVRSWEQALDLQLPTTNSELLTPYSLLLPLTATV